MHRLMSFVLGHLTVGCTNYIWHFLLSLHPHSLLDITSPNELSMTLSKTDNPKLTKIFKYYFSYVTILSKLLFKRKQNTCILIIVLIMFSSLNNTSGNLKLLAMIFCYFISLKPKYSPYTSVSNTFTEIEF